MNNWSRNYELGSVELFELCLIMKKLSQKVSFRLSSVLVSFKVQTMEIGVV